jgi:sterol desaturase/sphingolipid hydroxylase (fatty acid hydroxylase superfamily)
LRWLFASPGFHHWHHSNNREARDKNFAGQLSFLDALFGSLHLPRGQVPTAYGLDQPMPQRYVPGRCSQHPSGSLVSGTHFALIVLDQNLL